MLMGTKVWRNSRSIWAQRGESNLGTFVKMMIQMKFEVQELGKYKNIPIRNISAACELEIYDSKIIGLFFILTILSGIV